MDKLRCHNRDARLVAPLALATFNSLSNYLTPICISSAVLTVFWLLILLYYVFNAVLTQRRSITKIDQNTRDYLVWQTGNGDSMHWECVPHRIPRAWEQRGWSKRKKQTQE